MTAAQTARDDILDRAAAAALALAADRPWPAIALRDIAGKAEIPFAELYAAADSKRGVLAHLSARFDRAALGVDYAESAAVHDRLFDAAMARLEAMEPHRAALIAIARAEGPLAAAIRFPKTARAILEAAGVEATAARLAAMTAVWARAVQVWRDDEGALNRTMAELDKRLKQMAEQLGKIGAGF
ncbi:TetR family transcriptional regulator [uncultured Caulobacter sp.]|uniref:TetR family transcriptional regulator n=1 Tax=uncultured Caulobacter sp. TaxID=158749 RepID=UPI002616AAB6|nr:TetR family transcriptional regulator [uncultured Caulobacter sp.]